MRILAPAVALALLAPTSASFAASIHHHPGRLVPLLVAPWQGHRPAGTTWHDDARYGAPPLPTRTWARSQDGERYQRVDSYDVVLNGQIVGRDPDPNIRFQLLREAGFPPR